MTIQKTDERRGRKGDPRDEQRPVVLIDYETNKVLRRTRLQYRHLGDVKKRNAAAGNFFFSPNSMRFFSSRVQPRLSSVF